MPDQKQSHGEPLGGDYGNYGATGFNEVAPPSAIIGCIIGPEGSGKSSLFRDCPGCLLFNFDLHSMPRPTIDAPPPKWSMFPVINHKGYILDADLNRMPSINWGHYEEKIYAIIAAAKEGKPHPRMVVFDTLPEAVPLLVDWWAINKGALRKKWPGGIEEVPDGNAFQKVVGNAYNHVRKITQDLKGAGIGVWYLAHLVTKYIKVTDNDNKEKTIELVTHNIQERVYERVHKKIEFMAGIVKDTVQVPKDPNKPNGPKVSKPVRLLQELNIPGARARVPLPSTIELPPFGAWDVFERAYLEAAASSPDS